MELFIFARFHARPGEESAVEAALRDVVGSSREEAGCLSIHAFRSTRDGRLFYIHSGWADEAAFDRYAGLPHTGGLRRTRAGPDRSPARRDPGPARRMIQLELGASYEARPGVSRSARVSDVTAQVPRPQRPQ